MLWNSYGDKAKDFKPKVPEPEIIWKHLGVALHPLQWSFDCPGKCPTREEIAYALLHRGEPGCCTVYRNGKKCTFRYLHEWAIANSLAKKRKLYYVSNGRSGQALLYLDIDLHEPYQQSSDGERAQHLVDELLSKHLRVGRKRWLTSDRGRNGYLWVDCVGQNPKYANHVFRRFENSLRLVLADAECLADIEVKGKMAYLDGSRFTWKQFGKLPLHHDQFDREMFSEIVSTKVTLVQVVRLVDKIEQTISATVLERHKAHREALLKEAIGHRIKITPKIEGQLRALGTWKAAMSSRVVYKPGSEWIDPRYLAGPKEEKKEQEKEEEQTSCCKFAIKELSGEVNPLPKPVIKRPDTKAMRFWGYVKDLAVYGVPQPDHLADYLYELARPLLFRDYYDLPPEGRILRTIEDLVFWTSNKHNGHISRPQVLVEEQITRLVRLCFENTDDNLKAYYCQMRDNDSRYPHRIEMLGRLIRGDLKEKREEEKTSCCKCAIKEPIDDPLPVVLNKLLEDIAKAQKMRRQGGEYPFVRFARRLLNALWRNQGRAHINLATLQGYLGKKINSVPAQQVRYKRLLAAHGLIYPDWENYIRRGTRSALYRLTGEAYQEFQTAAVQDTKMAG